MRKGARMRGLLAVAVSLLLAGCSVGAGGGARTRSTTSDDWPGVATTGGERPHLVDESLASGGYSLLGAGATSRVSFDVPPGAIQVLLNVTFAGGAGSGFRAVVGGCALEVPAIVASGQVFGKDCGALGAGVKQAQLELQAGDLSGTLSVLARVCVGAAGEPDPTAGCPKPG